MEARTPCRVILVGMMGSGKSTVGRELSERTAWPYVDNDELVRRATGRTPRDLVAEQGEESMRRAERDALLAGLGLPEPVVVAAAAGTILDAEARTRIRDSGIVVWLRADPTTLATRASGAAHRPWLDGDATEWMRETLERRAPLYAEVATQVIDTDSGTTEEAVAAIVAWLDRHTECGELVRRVPGRQPA